MNKQGNFYKIDKQIKKGEAGDDIEIINSFRSDKQVALPIDNYSIISLTLYFK